MAINPLSIKPMIRRMKYKDAWDLPVRFMSKKVCRYICTKLNRWYISIQWKLNMKRIRDLILYRYWPGRSWNITFRWTAKKVIFSQGIIFSRSAHIRENITILAPPAHDISTVPVDICYIRWSKWMISSKLMCSTTTTKFGNKIRSLCTKQNWTQTWQLACVLLWRSIVNHCVLCVRGAFLSGSVS